MQIEPNAEKMVRLTIKDITTPVQPNILQGYMRDKELATQLKSYVYSLNILPMPVIRSPLWAYIVNTPGWQPRYSDSVGILTILRAVAECYVFNPVPLWHYKENKQHIDVGIGVFHGAMEKLHETQRKDIDLEILSQKNLTEKDRLGRFVRIMQKFTIDVINTYERLLHHAFLIKYRVEIFLTPEDCPHISVLNQDKKQIAKLMAHFFDVKQSILNGKLEGNKLPEQHFFNVKEIETRLGTVPQEMIFNGYLDAVTLAEYLNYVDVREK
jgi:hypothetical protein